ncbi:MAG: tetratricopeptide repeat protein [Bacteroidales bacterium]|nr:tetratricopeptide repeat protein [Bacteroidales bacterium]
MKKHLVIILALLFALSSCDSDLRRAKRYYQQAKEVAASDPDSALILIDSVLNIMVFLDDDIRMNMSLMQAEALFTHPDGERRELSQRIKAKKIYTMPELERSAEYFAEKGDYQKASYGALYSGYVLHELRDDAAMVCFKDAAKYAEITGDSLTYARANYNVARLLYEKYFEDQAIDILSKTEKAFGDNYVERALALNLMAGSNIVLGRFDNAEKCLEQSINYAITSKSTKAYWKIMNNYSVLYREKGEIEEAIEYLRRLDDEADTTKIIMHYLNMGITFVKGQQYDSADYYLKHVKYLLPLANIREDVVASAYNAFSVFEEIRKDYASALSYRKMHENLQFEIQDKLRKDNLYHINQKYDYETLQNTLNQRIISNYRIEMMLAVMIIIVLAVALVLYYRIIQKNKKEAEMKATLLKVMKDNENLIQDKSDNLAEKLRSMQRLEILTKDQKDKYLLANLEKEMFGDKNHWEVMTDLFNAIYPGLYDSLKEKYPDMSELERRVYMLNDFKLSRIDEALLLDVSTSVLDKARGKVKKLLEKDSVISTEA